MVRGYMNDRQTTPAAAGSEKKTPKAVSYPKRRRWPGAVVGALVALVIIVSLIAAMVPSLLPANQVADDQTRKIAALAIFVASYLALAIGKVPGLSIDRAGVALVGACLMVASGALPLEDAYKAIDLDTHHAAARHDDRRRQSAAVRLLRGRHGWVVRRAQRPAGAAWRGRRGVGRVLGLPGQRRDLPGAGAAGAGADARAEAQAGAVPAGGGDGVERRLDRDDHRQSAEHDDRQLLAASPTRDFAAALAPVALVGLVLTVVLIALLHRAEFAGGDALRRGAAAGRASTACWWPARCWRRRCVIALFFAGQPPGQGGDHHRRRCCC